MNSPQQDIVLIRKYHNGELSPAEKNALEARALDDAFLQDALDGYDSLGVNDEHLSAIEKKINQRSTTTKVVAPIWGIKQWSIAASILLCIALGSIYFNQNPTNKTIALNDLEHNEDIPHSEKLKIGQPANPAPAELGKLETIATSKRNIENPVEDAKADSYAKELEVVVQPFSADSETKDVATELAEVRIIGYGSQRKQALVGAVANAAPENLMISGIKTLEKQDFHIKVRGKIVDENDGTALPGVSIKNLESGMVKQSDINGEFDIELNQNDKLAFNYIGYETKNKTIQQFDDPITVTLKQDNAALNEVVVVGYGAQKRVAQNAGVGPRVGWQIFKDYLNEQANLANLGNGRVRLQFVINANGELSNFKIIDAFSEKAGVAAINIVKNYGGGWLGAADKMPQKTNITIKFK